MRYTRLFGKTSREVPRDAELPSHRYLVKGGFIDQLMVGSWTLLPLGWRVVNRINNIIREEMDKTGASEMLMPLMHPKDVWNKTGRWNDPGVREIMYQFKDKRGREFCLSFTHEEVVMDLVGKHISSYKDLPVKVYHFSTKFRNEPRARGGIIRAREFLMKDLYSVHTSEKDLMAYYEEVKQAYLRIFSRLDMPVRVVEAGGGVFTEKHTHEFQLIVPTGEDTVFYCDECLWGQNKEIFGGREGSRCPECKEGRVVSANAIEVGNIFPLGQKYAQMMGVTFVDKDGERKIPWFGSYGIGTGRVMGAIVECCHDSKGIIWPASVTPYDVHLLSLSGGESVAERIYCAAEESGLEVLYDDRDGSPGVKLADADLIGIPVRVIVSAKSIAAGGVEVSRRSGGKAEIVSVEKLAGKIKELYSEKLKAKS